jgi:hypothetical protein
LALIFFPSNPITNIAPAQIKLLTNIGTYIQLPGNHCLEYSDREMIGKCKILVIPTSIRNPNVGSAGTGFIAVATHMEVATITTLDPKWINAIITIIANFFISLYIELIPNPDKSEKNNY